ncbi:MAG: hypothetical protein JWO58_2025 [Chitinophagaceae bacterium]|nr:hypothetical protein [Chitinophagaceae bacterium]
MNKSNSIEKQEYLKYLSNDHHHSLLFCWKIRTGLRKGVEPERISLFCNWFFKHHLLAHFEIEESLVFPILGNDHELVRKALADHRKIKRLLVQKEDLIKSLNLLEEVLEKHIHFEERSLFHEIQKCATLDQGREILLAHARKQLPVSDANWMDKFW